MASIDNTPIVGHIKGGIHLAVGDTERGEEIMKSASSGTAAVIDGLVDGAMSGKVMADQIKTAVDSAVHDVGENFGKAIDLISVLKSKVSKSEFQTIQTLILMSNFNENPQNTK